VSTVIHRYVQSVPGVSIVIHGCVQSVLGEPGVSTVTWVCAEWFYAGCQLPHIMKNKEFYVIVIKNTLR
jgi:hypothetical protein